MTRHRDLEAERSWYLLHTFPSHGTFGATGRITLDNHTVYADDHPIGMTYPDLFTAQVRARTVYRGRPTETVHPDVDAAVEWVARRAAPKVWAAERGPVPRVSLTAGGWLVECGDPDHDATTHRRRCPNLCQWWWADRDVALADARERADRAHRRPAERLWGAYAWPVTVIRDDLDPPRESLLGWTRRQWTAAARRWVDGQARAPMAGSYTYAHGPATSSGLTAAELDATDDD